MARLLAREQYDRVVCHSVWSQAIFGPAVQSAGIPLAFWLHDAANGAHWLERWAKRTRPDAVICNSRFTLQTLPSLYREIFAEVIYCPVGQPQSKEPLSDFKSVRAELDTANDAIVIIQVGRMEALKGHRLCLEALAALTDFPDWVCWQVGGAQRPHEERYLEDLKSLARQLGIANRIRFVGQQPDVPRLLSAADIYCQPNTAPDSFGISFIEALSAKLPVVTTAMGGALEIVDDSCGLLIPPGDATALVASLRRLILDSDLRSRLGAAGPSRARHLCDPARQITRLYEFLRRSKARELAA
jgi:glycosyltransferase involved in cell wall biosynthesis